MIFCLYTASFELSQPFPFVCSCKALNFSAFKTYPSAPSCKKRRKGFSLHRIHSTKLGFWACVFHGRDVKGVNINGNSARRVATNLVSRMVSNDLEVEVEEIPQLGSNLTNFLGDPEVGKHRTQLGVMPPIPSPPINTKLFGLFVLCFLFGVAFGKILTTTSWRSVEMGGKDEGGLQGAWPQFPTNFPLFLERDLQKKESVEWLNMVLGKIWKVYKGRIENWVIESMQPVMDELEKPDYVEKVEIKHYYLGNEPISVRSIERRTSRRPDDLQYHVGIRYTGGAWMLLFVYLKFSFLTVVVPVGLRNLDIDGEMWVKLQLIPTEPWVGSGQWAFVSLPKVKFDVAPFRLFNLMEIPVLSRFLEKLLMEDLPRVFVLPEKVFVDFLEGKAVGPVGFDLKSEEMQVGNKDFVGELSVTLVNARKLPYFFYGKTDPYVILRLGDQVIRSKRNSQTTVVGPPGEPIWNQDFHMHVANPTTQKLLVRVKDSLGFMDLTVGSGEVELGSLEDTVPSYRNVVLQGGLGQLKDGFSGEILLRLTYKAFVEDEEETKDDVEATYANASDDEVPYSYEQKGVDSSEDADKRSFMDVLAAALIVSEEFQGVVASKTRNNRLFNFVLRLGITKASRSTSVSDEATPLNSNNNSKGSILMRSAVIMSVMALIALTLNLSSFFNP